MASLDSGVVQPASPDASGTRLFAWGARAIYLGPAFNLSAHRNAVGVIALGLDEPFGVAEPPAASSGRYRLCRSAIIPPNTLHHFADTQGLMAFIYVDALSRDLHHLGETAAARLSHAAFDLADEAALIGTLRGLASAAIDWPTARVVLERILLGPDHAPVDRRVAGALSLLHGSPDDRPSLSALASRAGLSESRLRHLFKATTGVPLRRYRIWVAMRVALQALSRGASITTAALDAGFASSAHFSTAFREMFGMEPSRLTRGGLVLEGARSNSRSAAAS
ncbi:MULTISPECIES: AraC family transcriptional regulator [unclassified Brevundimonas]|uniref:helix-turn-helix domain-containing protein n=1 Tax=unclassified Brevundimonas TaxID=2622653 RepID=UPI0006F7B5B6|nr:MULTISPECIES: AraC family transcriptional regulator [unclassified Brevundimonas]KQY95020.1 hypothetical protein ASD25_17015 [Brevundimonas sp. Root1423]KRA28506.1 hypothetical protein ASD59_01355 [Brevundimonas sp. Root608]